MTKEKNTNNMEHAKKEEIRQEANEIMDRGKAPTPVEIMRLAKKSGKSFYQIMGEQKKLKKDVEEARKKAEEEGREFSEAVYLKERMNEPQKRKIIVKRK